MAMKHWWTVYGPFDAGSDDLPHMGQVISHYTKLNGVTASTIAHMLTEHGWKVGERRMEQLMSQSNLEDPQQISRRRLLAQLLAIPPVLLGITEIATNLDVTKFADARKPTIDQETLARYESTLTSFWDSFYSGSVQKHWPSIEQWYTHLDELRTVTSGPQQAHVLTLLCRFGQLAAVIARDRTDFAIAMRYHNQSVQLARELNNAELIAASLVRQARTHTKQHMVNQALDDLKQALPYANRARPTVRGYTYQATAEVVSLLPATPESATQYLRFMDAAGKIIRSGRPEDDGSYMQLTATGYHQDRARGLLRLGKADEALEAISAAEQTRQPNMTRWQAESLILSAQAYAQMGEIEWACHELEEAIKVVKATNSSGKRQKLASVYKVIAQRQPSPAMLRHINALLKD